jgi:hypothetical protein
MAVLDALATVLLKPALGAVQVLLTVVGLFIAAGPLAVAAMSGTRLASDFISFFRVIKPLPLGAYVMSFASLVSAPYSNSVGPTLTRLEQSEDGGVWCDAYMVEQPWLRNPFASVHAVALANLGEYTGGVAMLALLQRRDARLRGIVSAISVEYAAKARGRIVAEARLGPLKELDALTGLQGSKSVSIDAVTVLRDHAGQTVATVTAKWQISCKPARAKAD